MSRRDGAREGGVASGVTRRARTRDSTWKAFEELRRAFGDREAVYRLWKRGVIAGHQRRLREPKGTM